MSQSLPSIVLTTIGLCTVLTSVLGQGQYFPHQNSPRQAEVFVNVYDHPKTGFSCAGKNPGDYYADPATKCAVYYVCIQNPTGTMSPQSFACPNGTIFSQPTRVCRPHEEVFCPLASRYYDSVNGNIDTKQDFAWFADSHDKPHQLAPQLPPQPQPPAPVLSQTQPLNHQPQHRHHQQQQQSNNFQPQPTKPKQTYRNTARLQPTSKSVPIVSAVNLPQPQPVPNGNNNAFNPNSNIARSFRNSNRNFNFALPSTQQQHSPQGPSPSLSTTSTTTTTSSPPPPALPSLGNPAQPGLADYEYDYGDYNETGQLVGAASSLQSQILENVKQNIRQATSEQLSKSPQLGPNHSTSSSFSSSSSQSSKPKSRRKRHSVDSSMLNRRKGQLTDLALDVVGSNETWSKTQQSTQQDQPLVPSFSCDDKIAGVAYADVQAECRQFFVCISISKGKLLPYQLSCELEKRFNQALGTCQASLSERQCRASAHYFMYNKWHRETKKYLLQSANKQTPEQR